MYEIPSRDVPVMVSHDIKLFYSFSIFYQTKLNHLYYQFNQFLYWQLFYMAYNISKQNLVGKYNISVSHMLQGLFDNNIWSWFEVELWWVPHVGQEMLTLSGTPDLTPTGVHIHFLPWVRSANFVCPWTILYGCWFWFVCLAESGFVVYLLLLIKLM